MLQAIVPRNLRIRASVQIAGQRLPARGFILVAGVVFLGGVAVVFGTDIQNTLWSVATVALTGLVLVEGRLWGRSSQEIARILGKHFQRPHLLRHAPVTIVLPVEVSRAQIGARLPRWMTEEVKP